MTTKRPIVLSPALHLPVDIVTEAVAVLAARRAGKSVLAKNLYEQLHHAGIQTGAVDPKGDWWGLRSSRDGKRPGLPVLIIGGEHGDVPLEPGSGELVAQLVVRERVSFVLDLSELSKSKTAVFMAAFLETLYRMKAKDQYRTPMHLVVDEADAIAPQRPNDGEQRMLGAAEDIVRRGGQRGIGITLVSQRAAVLNKNVLTQCGVLFLLRTGGSQDIDAVDEWIKKHGQPEKRAMVLASIATLPRGTAWAWAPGWPDDDGIFKKVEINLNETFDSGRTPKPGETLARPKTVADVDLDAFRLAMAETIEKAKESDPSHWKAQVADLNRKITALTRDLEAAKSARPANVVPIRAAVIPFPLQAAELDAMDQGATGMTESLDQLQEMLAGVRRRAVTLRQDIHRRVTTLKVHAAKVAVRDAAPAPQEVSTPATRAAAIGRSYGRELEEEDQRHARDFAASAARAPQLRAPVNGHHAAAAFGKGPTGVLRALASFHPTRLSTIQVATLCGYSASGGGFRNYLGALRTAGLIQQGDPLVITDAGLKEAGPVNGPTSSADLIAVWSSAKRIKGAPARLLLELYERYPRFVPIEQLAAKFNYEASGGGFRNYLGALRSAGLVEDRRGEGMRAHPNLFLGDG